MQLSPALTAAIDQKRATLAAAVRSVREHRAVCTVVEEPNVCPGADVLGLIQETERSGLESLLGLALCALAAAGQADPLASDGVDGLLAELDQEGNG